MTNTFVASTSVAGAATHTLTSTLGSKTKASGPQVFSNDTGIGGDDILNGDSGNDTIYGNGGKDTITGGSGSDVMDGEEGSDTYNIQGSDANGDTFSDTGGTSGDLIKNTGGTLTLLSFAPTGTTTTYSGIETFDGNNQAIHGNNSANALDFSGIGSVVNVPTINTFDGADMVNISTFAAAATVNAGNQNDSVIGSAFGDTFNGEGGNDTINAGAGDDIIRGGSGADDLYGEGNNDTFQVAGTEMQGDFIDGGANSDTIVNVGGGTLTQLEFKPLGTDLDGTNNRYVNVETFDGNNQAIHGNNSANALDFSGIGSVVNVPTINTFDGADMVNISTFAAAATVNAGNQNDSVIGSALGDTLNGEGGNDTINAGAGDDIIRGGSGADVMDGGADNDTYNIQDSDANGDTFSDTGGTSGDLIKNTGGTLTLLSFAPTGTTTTYTNVETFDGMGQVVQGDNGANTIDFSGFTTTTGVPTVNGLNGNDLINVSTADAAVTVNGGNDNDTIYGSNFADTLNGDSGNDTIYGKAGDDTLTGGNNSDRFVFESVLNDGMAETDTLSDFKVGSGTDKIEIGITGGSFDNNIVFISGTSYGIDWDGVMGMNPYEDIIASNVVLVAGDFIFV
jgi:Ca2+-binding RTX toxin-like protein